MLYNGHGVAVYSQEQRFGSIIVGKCADLTIFDQDIFTMPADELLDVNVAGTIVNGEFKYTFKSTIG